MIVHYLKVVIAQRAFKFALAQAAVLETCAWSCTDMDLSCQASQATLYLHEQICDPASRASLMDNLFAVCWNAQKQLYCSNSPLRIVVSS
jgi:hypothetical protein